MERVILTEEGKVYLFNLFSTELNNSYPHLTSGIIQTSRGTVAELNIEPSISVTVNDQCNVLAAVSRRTRTVFLYPSDRVPESLREPIEISEITDVVQIHHVHVNLLILDARGNIYSYMVNPDFYSPGENVFQHNPEFAREARRRDVTFLQSEKIVRFESLPPIRSFVGTSGDLILSTFGNEILRLQFGECAMIDGLYYIKEDKIKTISIPFHVETVTVATVGSLTITSGNGKSYVMEKHSGDKLPWKASKNNIPEFTVGEFNIHRCPLKASDVNNAFFNYGTLFYLNASRELCSIIGEDDRDAMVEQGAELEEDRVMYEPYTVKSGSFDCLYELSEEANFLLTRGNELYFYGTYHVGRNQFPFLSKPELIHVFPGVKSLKFDHVNIPRQMNKSARS